jgi:hypothetical protein
MVMPMINESPDSPNLVNRQQESNLQDAIFLAIWFQSSHGSRNSTSSRSCCLRIWTSFSACGKSAHKARCNIHLTTLICIHEYSKPYVIQKRFTWITGENPAGFMNQYKQLCEQKSETFSYLNSLVIRLVSTRRWHVDNKSIDRSQYCLLYLNAISRYGGSYC